MESELLKEPWTFPQTKSPDTTAKEEDNSTVTFPDWEENFQDLSGWCMDTFQTRCNFPAGELLPFKLSGTKYEGNGVSTVVEQVSENMTTSRVDKDKWGFKMDSFDKDTQVRSSKNESLSSHSLRSTSNHRRVVVGDVAAATGANESLSASCLRLPKTSAAIESKENATTFDINASFQSGHQQQVDDLDLKDACQTVFVTMEDQHEPWDMLRGVQANGTDAFDLISYIYEDELHSPTGSTSTESSMAVKSRSPNQQSLPKIVQNVEKAVETDETVGSVKRSVQTRSTSTGTSSDIYSSTLSFGRTKSTVATNKMTKKYSNSSNNERYESLGRKRHFEDDDDDDDSDSRMAAINYRESREKNNEASRKSRMNKKAKETEMAMRAIELEKDNRILKMKVEELEKLVISMRTALLRSAMKKEN